MDVISLTRSHGGGVGPTLAGLASLRRDRRERGETPNLWQDWVCTATAEELPGAGRGEDHPSRHLWELSSAHTPLSLFWPSEPRENIFLLLEATTLGHVITAAPGNEALL